MNNKKRQWTIEELIDLETCMIEFKDDLAGDQLIQTNIVNPLIEQRPELQGEAQMHLGMATWMKHRLKQVEVNPSDYWEKIVSGFSSLLLFVAALFGISAVVGLVRWSDKSLNIGLMIGLVVFLPWLIFVVFGFFRKLSGSKASVLLSWLQSKVFRVLKKSGFQLERCPNTLKKPLSKVVFLTLQKASLIYAVMGLLAMLALVLFFEIRFYWESTLGESMATAWHQICSFLSLPWAWSGYGVPTMEDVELIQMKRNIPANSGSTQMTWAYFSIGCILVWSFVPRLFLLLYGKLGFKRSLSKVELSEKSHRQLWRRLYIKSIASDHKVEDDGAVIVDYGGWSPNMEVLRPYLLQKLRLNPKYNGVMGTIDSSNEQEVVELVKEHDIPVVFCCEAAELSPRSLEAAVRKLRLHRDDLAFYILPLDKNLDRELDSILLGVWEKWIDDFADPLVRMYVLSDKWLKGAAEVEE